ncbi:MAG: alpha/beta hydrolase [Pseudomonadota bacterium]
MDTLLPTIELTTGPQPQASVIWLHGMGADGNDFVPVIKELNLPASKPIRFIFPHAPMRPISINGGYVMRAWYDLGLSAGQLTSKEEDVRASQQSLEMLIEQEINRGIPAEKIILAGFSQGGVIALQTGLRYPKRLGGILALSTYLALHESLPAEGQDANKNIPIYMAHGLQDPIVPLVMAIYSRNELQRLGYQVEWHEYHMQHSLCAEEIESISGWFQSVL